MSHCKSCSAPLLANTNVCRYCGVRNDIDLHGKFQYYVNNKQSRRICPECNTHLQTIDLNNSLLIEHCQKCFGLFFDPGEIETMLEYSVSNVFQINLELLRNINKDRYQKQNHKKIKYIKCPVCQGWMKRNNFGYRSGVIINQCKQHGIWLGSGQITHLMEWKKAGGQILHNQKSEAMKAKKNTRKIQTDFENLSPQYSHKSYQPDLIESVTSLVFKLFD